MLPNERKPEWLKIRYRSNRNTNDVAVILKKYGLNTVCDEAMCPNKAECFSKRTAAFMILGNNCTRNCTFCSVQKEIPTGLDHDEPENVALAVKNLGLSYVVITSVTRDDLPDGGAGQFAACIREIRKLDSDIRVEVLIPDFQGDKEALKTVLNEKPFVLNHNIETVKRLYPEVRSQAIYERSLELLRRAAEFSSDIYTKSGIMLGLGETRQEVLFALKDLADSRVSLLTIGQYLAPSGEHHRVVEYIHPDIFDEYKKAALEMGFSFVASGPFVRSSYNAAKAVKT